MVSYLCFREEETEAQGGWIQEDMAGLCLNQSVGASAPAAPFWQEWCAEACRVTRGSTAHSCPE